MANLHKEKVLKLLQERYGKLRALPKTKSLFVIEALNIKLYFRYSKISSYGKNAFKSFYGLRFSDLKALQGSKAFVIFLSDYEDKISFCLLAKLKHYALK